MKRSKFQGLRNVVRFNYDMYIKAAIVLGLAFTIPWPQEILWLVRLGALGASYFLLSSLAASHYIYDRSDLYGWSWMLDRFPALESIVNIHSGFDETTSQLRELYPEADLTTLDFYDPTIITEPSIEIARKLYPSPKSVQVKSDDLPLDSGQEKFICCILAAHELREQHQKVAFLREVKRSLQVEGHFLMLEHMRDTANFLAFGPGFVHFFSRRTWVDALTEAGLSIREEFTLTPFLRGFVCRAASES